MKEFDFVKFTIGLALLLSAGFLGAWLWFDRSVQKLTVQIHAVEEICRDVGETVKDIKLLEKEKSSDKAPDLGNASGIHSFFAQQAQRAGILPNEDYALKPRDPGEDKKNKVIDQQFVIDFKGDRPKKRDNIFGFIFNVESQSRRIKLQKASIKLDEAHATEDLWIAQQLTFVRRDPMKQRAKE